MSMQAIIYGYRGKSHFDEDVVRVEYQEATKKLNGRTRPSGGRLTTCAPYNTSQGALPRDVIECPALLGHLSRERVGHRDQKPLALIEKLILASSRPDDLVLDCFAGSGTTGVACLRTGRKFILIEQNPEYYKLSKDRLLAEKE